MIISDSTADKHFGCNLTAKNIAMRLIVIGNDYNSNQPTTAAHDSTTSGGDRNQDSFSPDATQRIVAALQKFSTLIMDKLDRVLQVVSG